MTDQKGKVGVDNWIGKIILIVIGTAWMAISFYPHAMADLFLTERVVSDWGTLADVAQLIAQIGLILGGTFLNKALDFFIGFRKPRS